MYTVNNAEWEMAW